MRLSETTIQRVRDLRPSEVIGRYISLKAKGNKYSACCPIHDEKTPSFWVHDSKGYFKCFGCGAAGDGIQFVMNHCKLDFAEAVEEIAQRNGIDIEREAQDPEQAAADQQEAKRRASIRIALEWAAAWFQANDLPTRWAERRRLAEDVRTTFRMGAAPSAPRRLYDDAIRQGFAADVLVEAGLVKDKSGTFYDVFQDRVMVPIRDVRGRVVAFTGRLITEPAPDASYQPAKYLNSSDAVWTKGDHLFALDVACSEISKKKHAYLVEGQMDAMQMWQSGLKNTVASGGTALTANQIKLLAKYTMHVILTIDNDKAGLEALPRNAEALIRAGFRVEVLIPERSKGSDKTDPDDYLRRKVHTIADLENWTRTKQDYLTGWLLKQEELAGTSGPHERAQAIGRLGGALEWIQNDTVRGSYYDTMGGLWSDFKKYYKLAKRGHETSQSALRELDDDTRSAFFDQGYFEKDGGLWTQTSNKGKIRICPFTFNVLYFIMSATEPKYVCSFRNIFGEERYTAITTDDFTSVSTFRKCAGRLGNFVFEGTDEHLNKIKIKEFHGVPQAKQPRYMGWNPAGFQTWANGLLFENQFIEADRYGIVTLKRPFETLEQVKRLPPSTHVALAGQRRIIKSGPKLIEEMGEEQVQVLLEQGRIEQLSYHYLPFASSLKLDGDVEEEGFETEKLFVHFNVPGLTFAEWSKLVRAAYVDNGIVMISFYLAAIFRDIIYEANSNYFPLLCHFGPPSAGKSKAAEVLAAMFGRYQPDGINLEGGSTVIGIRRYMDNIQNGIIWLNEYKDTLSSTTLGMIKSIADGGGRLSGQKSGGNETKSTIMRSAAIVCGQDIPAKDAAILTRCLVNEFSEASKDKNDLDAYNRLVELRQERKLTAVTCELMKYRDAVAGYQKRLPAVQREMKEVCLKMLGRRPDDRTILNITSVLTPLMLLAEAGLELPFTIEEARDELMMRVRMQVKIQETTNDVEQYFNVVASMIGKEVIEGTHYKIQREVDGKTKLFLRVNQVHGAYLVAAQRQGKAALGTATVRGYLAQSRYFLEDRAKGVRFVDVANPTSAMIFDYEMMRRTGIEFDTKAVLETMMPEDDPSAELVSVKPLVGNGREQVFELLDELRPNSVHHVDELRADFNEGHRPALTTDRFVELLKRYADEKPKGRQLTFSSDYTRIRIEEPVCPF